MSVLEKKRYYTVQECAKILGITPGRVRQFIMTGRLKAEKFGFLRAIPEEEVQKLAQQERRPGRPKSVA